MPNEHKDDGVEMKYTNITSTFTGIGYAVVDVNGLVLEAVRSCGLQMRQLPLQTVRGYCAYVRESLRVSSLCDMRFVYEMTGDPWLDYLVRAADDGSFARIADLGRAVSEDRVAVLLTVEARTGLVAYARKVGLYVGLLETVEFDVPYAYCQVLGPCSSIDPSLSYLEGKDTTQDETSLHDETEESLSLVEEYLSRHDFTIESMNAAVENEEDEYVYEEYSDMVDKAIAHALLNVVGKRRLLFDGRVCMGKRSVAPERPAPDRSVFANGSALPWSGKDLELLMPPIPERPNLRHLANIRRSAQSMYDGAFQYATVGPTGRTAEGTKKESAKMQRIKEENAARIRAEKEKSANAWLRCFYGNYARLTTLAAKKSYVESIRLDSAYINNKLSLLKAELYMDLWRLEQLNTPVNEKVLVPLYLECLAFVTRNCVLRETGTETARPRQAALKRGAGAKGKALDIEGGVDAAELEFVLTKLVEAGFEATVHELTAKYAMPPLTLPFRTKATAAPNDIDLYFQLKYAGDHLQRTLGTRSDPRVPFDPDRWQVELLDAVDANKSAIVSAPTSCGKTFICFYAIEKVLRASDTDIAIFCLPTKALANQVSADIYARFSPKNCRMALQGTLMADRCVDPLNCQILITIPCMLESLLASRNTDAIKYIIIDEVHKINDETIGLSIERIVHMARCPLLLLSATIGNLEGFYGWFRALEQAKGRECALVTHGERYCELKPFVYRMEETTHCGLSEDLSQLCINNSDIDKSDGVSFGSRSPSDQCINNNADRNGTGSSTPRIKPKGTLLALNCMFAYSFTHLKDFGFSNDIAFLPEELLNLYYYIYMVLDDTHKRLIKKLAPKKFFKSNIITKAGTREYQQHLLSVFERWVREGILGEAQVREVYGLLVGDSLTAFPVVFSEEALVAGILDLLFALEEKEMLPVIVFNTDRDLVTRLARAVHAALEGLDQRKRRDRQLEKLRKEQKRTRDAEKTRDSWIEESIMSEAPLETDTRDIRCTFLDPATRLSDAEVREELAEARNTPRFMTDMVHRGIGIHHAAVERKYRAAVEILFRKKHVRVLFATETLALGINMPCRTVVFAGDSLALDPMNYRQMAGRAGRRGYDTLGNVVFMGIPRTRVQNLMVSRLPQVRGAFPYANTSLISFNIEEFLISKPLLASNNDGNGNGNGDNTNTVNSNNNVINTSNYTFPALLTEESRRILVETQKSLYPTIFPSNYLWDLFVSNRAADPAIFIFGLMLHADKVDWDHDTFLLTIAHLFETQPVLNGPVLPPLPPAQDAFISAINSAYDHDIRAFYSPQLRSIANMRSEPLHIVRSFIRARSGPKNSYIYDFCKHGSSVKIRARNNIPEGQLWQALYNIDYFLSSLSKLLTTLNKPGDQRPRRLAIIYDGFHKKFKDIFA